MINNPFIPRLAQLTKVQKLTPDVRLFGLKLFDGGIDFQAGQFALLSAFGQGEAAFTFASLNELEFAIRKVGTVTTALHELEEGAIVGIRGPYGNSFPLEEYQGKNILIIGGGIGIAPLRPIIQHILKNRQSYRELLIIYGARTPKDLVFASEYELWANSHNTKLELTVDRGDESWKGRVALVPHVVKELRPSPENALAIICGPPIMIRLCIAELITLGFSRDQIITTLEAKMKCGLGKCARCNFGDKYVCLDGPVFTLKQIEQFLEKI